MSQVKCAEANSWTESQVMSPPVGGAWDENTLPIGAAQVFRPAPICLRDSWDMEAEKRPFIQQHFLQDESLEEAPHTGHCCGERLLLKMAVSLGTSALLFPFLVWGGYVFLPFDAPVMQDAPMKLVYTLRCSVFATLLIALGYVVLGVSRLRSNEVRPLEASVSNDVTVHRNYVSDSAHLFLLYFLQLGVMATYLSQDQLKLVPLLTVLFCLGRLVYWVAAAFQSSVRAFGFGLCFLPSLTMMAANLYFLVTMEMGAGAFVLPQTEQTPPPGRQRFWG